MVLLRPRLHGVKRGFITGVKKGRLFERSEFLPFSGDETGVAGQTQP